MNLYNLLRSIGRLFLRIPFINNNTPRIYRWMRASIPEGSRVSKGVNIVALTEIWYGLIEGN